tara:strand:- start:943 stop:3213 length:2271 start_codon:yes stop_codon:yes gene_type:complete
MKIPIQILLSVDDSLGQPPILDMFKDESLTIKKMVKDLNDPKKLFTSLSRSFSIPASKKNNIIFKHYYNIDIINGLDSRELIPCKILLNNVTQEVGNLSIEGVKMSNGKAMSYNVRYIGKLSELSRKIGQDKLSTLDFSSSNIPTFSPVTHFSDNTVRDLVFPLASRSKRMLYDLTNKDINIEGAKNISFIDYTSIADNKYGVNDQDLIGALKVGTILDNIASAYSISFSGVFDETYVRDLYLWLHKTDKERAGEKQDALSTDITFSSGNVNPFNSTTVYNDYINFDSNSNPKRELGVKIQGNWTGEATVFVKFNGAIVRQIDTSGSSTSYYYMRNTSGNLTFSAESDSSITINLNITVVESFRNDSSLTEIAKLYTSTINTGNAGHYQVVNNLPTMKILDFLSSLFKMFNIVAEVDDALNIKTTHFDHFMSNGVSRDISEYVDTSSYNVNRPNVFSAMRFKFADPKVAMEIGYEKVNGKQYGELEYDLIGQTGVKLSGNEYTLDIPNQRVPLEPLTDLSYVSSGFPVVFFPLIYSQFSDLKGAEQQTKPMFTYISKNFASNPLSYDTGGTIARVTEYITPSNVFTDDFEPSAYPSTGLLGLYFGEELNEYNAIDSTVGFGLFNNFYKGLTAMMFDEDKRSVVFKSFLPSSLVKQITLSDTLTINNSFYSINSIETNYLNGESKLDLTLVGMSKLSYFTKKTIRVTNTGAVDLRITYLNQSGVLEEAIILIGNFSDIALVGEISSFSNSEYTLVEI